MLARRPVGTATEAAAAGPAAPVTAGAGDPRLGDVPSVGGDWTTESAMTAGSGLFAEEPMRSFHYRGAPHSVFSEDANRKALRKAGSFVQPSPSSCQWRFLTARESRLIKQSRRTLARSGYGHNKASVWVSKIANGYGLPASTG